MQYVRMYLYVRMHLWKHVDNIHYALQQVQFVTSSTKNKISRTQDITIQKLLTKQQNDH